MNKQDFSRCILRSFFKFLICPTIFMQEYMHAILFDECQAKGCSVGEPVEYASKNGGSGYDVKQYLVVRF